jgi:hypothetical protein
MYEPNNFCNALMKLKGGGFNGQKMTVRVSKKLYDGSGGGG